MSADNSTAVFFAELILLLVAGRGIGELMNRVGQPAIFGQLLAGIVLGPSVFGALLPDLHHLLFPGTDKLKAMIGGLSEVSIALLLLLTGMETNLALVQRRLKTVALSSLSGIAVPFVAGFALTWLLPEAIAAPHGARLIAGLFVGTALSISSVKIVAIVLMEVGAIRRDIGQLILSTAILDDTIAWVLIAIISGLAAHGSVDLASLAMSVGGAAVFLGLALTLGRWMVARAILWTHDTFTIEVPVVSVIIVIMFGLALTTDMIGVHTALGAFVAGLLVGQSPILTEHIDSQIRGFVFAFFSPVFFALAGLGMDIRTLLDPTMLGFTVLIIVVASLGKFGGALAGGMLAGLKRTEALALATGLNARGSTEVIVATIGLGMGFLSHEFYTMIVAMAVATTMAMPPLLRLALARVKIGPEEQARLDKEEAEARQSVPKMERAIVIVDDSSNGRLAAHLAGVFSAGEHIATTVMKVGVAEVAEAKEPVRKMVLDTAAVLAAEPDKAGEASKDAVLSPPELVLAKPAADLDTIMQESRKGYDIAFVGIERPFRLAGGGFGELLRGFIGGFDEPCAIALNAGGFKLARDAALRILVPTGGTAQAVLATEVAVALARASGGSVSVLHITDPAGTLRGGGTRTRRAAATVLGSARRLGSMGGVAVDVRSMAHSRPEQAIAETAAQGGYDLVVVGVAVRRGERKFLGPRGAALVHGISAPLLVVAQ